MISSTNATSPADSERGDADFNAAEVEHSIEGSDAANMTADSAPDSTASDLGTRLRGAGAAAAAFSARCGHAIARESAAVRRRLAPHFSGIKVRAWIRADGRARKPLLIAVASVVGLVAVLGGTFIALAKTVTISVDGVAHQVTTVSRTVDGALSAAGITLGAHDAVAPAGSTTISDGSKVVVHRGRLLNLTVDGTQQHFWTTASTVSGAFDQMGESPSDYELSVNPSADIPVSGLSVSAATLHTVTITLIPAPGDEQVAAPVAYEKQALHAVPAVATQQPTHVRTAAKNVGDLLEQQDITIGADNRVSPSLDSPLTDGMNIAISTLPTVDVTVGDQVTKQIIAEAPTVGELLAHQSITVGEHDIVTPGVSTAVTDGLHVTIDRVEIKTTKKKVEIAQPADEKVKDNSLAKGTTKVKQKGHPGEATVTYETKVVNGKAGKAKEVSRKVVTKATPTVIRVGTYVAPPPKKSSSSGSGSASNATPSTSGGPGIGVWERIAQCESTNNWHINTGNGYYGGLQFDISTWLGNGGGKYAPRADLATKAQQIDIANNVYKHRGLRPWGCAYILGMV